MTAAIAEPDPGSAWVAHLERAHRAAHFAAGIVGAQVEPSPHLLPAAHAIEGGCAALYDAFSGRIDRPTAIGTSHSRLWTAAVLTGRAGLGEAVRALRLACAELIGAERRLPDVPIAGPRSAPLLAGTTLPRLHVLSRTPLAPKFSAPPLPVEPMPLPVDERVRHMKEPNSFAELAAAAAELQALAKERIAATLAPRPESLLEVEPTTPVLPTGFARAPAPAVDDAALVARWARDCFDEVGMLGLQRAPVRGDAWREIRPLETRMVRALDAFAALGPEALGTAERLALDAPAPDPMRVFAMTMIGGSIEGRDAIAAAERVLTRFGAGDPLVAEAFAAAMKLVPHPHAANVLRSLMTSDEHASRRLGVEVLAYRRWLTEAELGELAHDEDDDVFCCVLVAQAMERHPDLNRTLLRARGHASARVQLAALHAMVIAASVDAGEAARAAAGGALGRDAYLTLALAGTRADAAWLVSRLGVHRDVATIEAVGWAGLLDAVPVLIDALRDDDEALKLAAGEALERLLGCQLMDVITIDAEELDDVWLHDPDPDPRPERVPLDELVSDPRERPPQGSPETLEVPSIDRDRWSSYWNRERGRLDADKRYRRGQHHSPSVLLYELDQLKLSVDERRTLQRELCLRTGHVVRFDPHDFVVVQEECLLAWGAVVARGTRLAGTWERG